MIYKNLLCYFKLFFQSLWQVLLLPKEELDYPSNEIKNILSMNNSADEDYSKNIYQKLPRRRYRHRLPKNNFNINNKTRVTVRSLSNQNFNQTELKEKNPSNTLGTINSHIIVVPIDSSHCQNINLREELADALCRHSHEPLTFINRGTCCGHCQPVIFPYVPPTIPQETDEQSPQIEDNSKTQSTPYSPGNESLSIGTITNNEQNHSILSFPEHDTSPLQESEELIDDDDDNQLHLNAQILVDDSMQTAQEILRLNTNQDQQDNRLDSVKQIIENQSKLATTSNKSKIEKLSNDHTLCQQLCNKLNLSDSNQISEIIDILASNAPHILKEQPSTTNKNLVNENKLCSQLLLHPPFKPKRLIHLCPDGSIQVLSSIDEQSNNNQEQFRLDYSNSATKPVIQQNHILTNESSLGLVDHLIMNNNNSILTLQQNNDPIVKIDLDLNDELTEENSLPEIFFKRIIVPESPVTVLTDKKNEVPSVHDENHRKSRRHRSRSYKNIE